MSLQIIFATSKLNLQRLLLVFRFRSVMKKNKAFGVNFVGKYSILPIKNISLTETESP